MRKNFTRRSASIARRLVRERAYHLLPIYGLLRLSDLAAEGTEHSGSFRFADHIYVGTASGRTPFGRWLDSRLLSMPAARAFRRRCDVAQRVIRAALERSDARTLRVLAVPCGIPRDLVELATTLTRERPELLLRLEYHGMDIDPAAIDAARAVMPQCGAATVRFHQGDALNESDYPAGPFDVVVSTGLGEFLDDHELAAFYANVHRVLAPGGTFYTSATARDHRSDLLLKLAELEVHYRRADDVAAVLDCRPWRRVLIQVDPTGLQTFVTAMA